MFWIWVDRFFSYFPGGVGPGSYSDDLGEGPFGWRHLLWMLVVVAVAILAGRWFAKHPKQEKRIVFVLVVELFLFRFFHQTARALIGVETPWTQAFPFHMCTVLTFLLPLTVVFDWKKIKTAVYTLSIMGGTITLILGDYFGSRFLNLYAWEGMWAHTLLIWVPIFELASKRHVLSFKDAWTTIAGILILMGWASLANHVFYKGLDPNYMYLMHNELPFGNDQNFFFFYVLIFLVFFFAIFGINGALKRRSKTT
jgi:uncharacterized membrane protein YwaF